MIIILIPGVIVGENAINVRENIMLLVMLSLSTNLASESLQIDTDFLLIMKNTAGDLSAVLLIFRYFLKRS